MVSESQGKKSRDLKTWRNQDKRAPTSLLQMLPLGSSHRIVPTSLPCRSAYLGTNCACGSLPCPTIKRDPGSLRPWGLNPDLNSPESIAVWATQLCCYQLQISQDCFCFLFLYLCRGASAKGTLGTSAYLLRQVLIYQ